VKQSFTTPKILIDIKHPAQLNLFKGLARQLMQEGWEVTISYLGRGKLPNIIRKEYDGFNTIQVGSSRGSKWSIFWEGNVKRTLSFFRLIFKNRYDICIAASSVPLAFASCPLSQCHVLLVEILKANFGELASKRVRIVLCSSRRKYTTNITL